VKTWKASITIDLGTINAADLPQERDYIKIFFKDLNNPTDEEVEKYFQSVVENYAGSNDGSELLANSPVDIEVTEQ
jgi:hypothetical protein